MTVALATFVAMALPMVGCFSSTDGTVEVSGPLAQGTLSGAAPSAQATPKTPSADYLELVSGDLGSAAAGADLGTLPQLRVRDASGTSLKGITLSIEVVRGGGSVPAATVVSGDDGLATILWKLGETSIGRLNNLLVVRGESGVLPNASGLGLGAITLSATSTSAWNLTLTSGAIQSGGLTTQAGSCVGITLGGTNSAWARVSLVSSQSVTISGGSALFYGSSDSSCSGTALGVITLSSSQGPSEVSFFMRSTTAQNTQLLFSSDGFATASLSASISPSSADAITLVSGDQTTAAPGAQPGQQPTVRVIDRYGNSVSGVNLSAQVLQGGGTLGSSSLNSDANGLASASWTLGESVLGTSNNQILIQSGGSAFQNLGGLGLVGITFSATTTSSWNFTLTSSSTQGSSLVATAGSCVKVTLTSANSGGSLAPLLSTRLITLGPSGSLSAYGSGDTTCAGSAVTLITLSSSSTRSEAIFYLRDLVAESPQVAVSGGGFTASTLRLSISPASADALTLVSGDQTTAAPGAQPGQQPTVRVIDRYGNSVPSVNLSAQVVRGGGSVSSSSLTSGAGGQASATWTLGESVLGTSNNQILIQSGGTAFQNLGGLGLVGITFSATTTSSWNFTLTSTSTQGSSLVATAGSCVKVTLTSANSSWSLAPLLSTRLITLGPSGSLSAYGSADTTCAGSAVTLITLTSSNTSSEAIFYLRDTVAESPQLALGGGGFNSASILLSISPDSPDYLTILAGGGQTAPRGRPVSTTPSARLTDRYGNSVSGVTLATTIVSGGGSAGAANVTTSSSGVVTTSWTLGTGAAGANSNILKFYRSGTALPDLAGTTRSEVTLTATSTNTNPTLNVPASRVPPLTSSLATGPLQGGGSAGYTFTLTSSDENGDTISYTCSVESLGLHTSDPGYVASSTSCNSLASYGLVSSVLSVTTSTFAGGVLTWWPLITQKGTYRFTFGASDGQGGTATGSTDLSVVPTSDRSNLVAVLDSAMSLEHTGLSGLGVKPRLDGSGDDAISAAWQSLVGAVTGVLNGLFGSATPWSGTGEYSDPYALNFNGSSDRMNMGSALAGSNKVLVSAWVKPADVTAAGKVILSTGGGSGNGIILKQSELNPGKVELQVGPNPTYTSVVLRDRPVAYWRLNETSGTTATDLSGNAYHGTYHASAVLGAAGGIAGETSYAASLSGANYIMQASTGAQVPSGTASRSIEAWIYETAYTGTILALGNTGGTNRFLFISLEAGGTTYIFSDGVNTANNRSVSGAEIPPLNQWNHVAVTYDSMNWKYFLNGAYVKGGALAVEINTGDTQLRIGNRMDYDQPWTGRIQDVAMYAYPLSAQQVANHYQAGKNGYFTANKILAYGPTHYWPLSEAPGASYAYDNVSSEAITLQYFSTARSGYPGLQADNNRPAVQFKTANADYLQSTANFTGTGKGISILAWLKFNGSLCGGGAGYVFSMGPGNAGTPFFGLQTWCTSGADNRVTAYATYGGTPTQCSAAASPFVANTWTHVALTADYAGGASGMVTYRNGTAEATCSTTTISRTAADLIDIARASTGVAYNNIDMKDVAIFDRVLTASEIQDIASGANAQKCLSTTTLTNSSWTFLSGIWNGSSLSLFVDGQKECAVTPSNVSITASTDAYVGATASGTSFWQGAISEIQMRGTSDGSTVASDSTVTLDFAESAARYKKYGYTGSAEVTDGLILHLDAATAKRGVGAYANGTCETADQNWFGFGGPGMQLMNSALMSFTAGACSSSAGWVGDGSVSNPYAIAFDGVGKRVITGANSSANALTNNVSVELWLKPGASQTSTYRTIFGKPLASGAGIIMQHNIGSTTDVYFGYSCGGSWCGASSGTTFFSWTTQVWQQIVISKSGANIAVYLNGALATSAVMTNAVIDNSSYANFKLGAWDGSGAADLPWTGSIAKFSVYNTALTQAQVRQNCAAFAARFGVVCK